MKKNKILILIFFFVCACSGTGNSGFRQDIKTWTLHAESNALFCGTVSSKKKVKGDLYVVAVKEPDAPNIPRMVLNFNKLEMLGFFGFIVPVGSVSVFAFEDMNGNKKHDPGEQFGTYKNGNPVFLDNGRILYRVDFDIESSAEVFPKFEKMSIEKEVKSSYVMKKPEPGTKVKIDHYYFDPGFGALGMWRPLELSSLQGPSIFFLDEYDENKTPVLFIHGISGTPDDFKYFCENIDRNRYHVMFFQYPSGFRLDGVVAALDYDVSYIVSKYGMKKIIVVAHSMGGLIARTFIQRFHNSKGNSLIKKFVSISSPYGGHDLASFGVRNETKSFVPVWIDMVPGSDFQKRMSKTPLNVPFYLFYGNRPHNSEKDGDGDGTVSIKSMLDGNVAKDAIEVFQFSEDHMSILNSEKVFGKLMEVFEKQD